MTLDANMRWKAQIEKEREEISLKHKKIYWIIGRRSALSMNNKLILNKPIFIPVCTYGIQVWGGTNSNKTDIIQRCQNKVIRNFVVAPCYIRDTDHRTHLQMDMVTNEIRKLVRRMKRGFSTTSKSL